jgi:transposase
VFYILEEACTGVPANSTQVAQAPGRKTDVNDAVWIAQLLEHGLIRPSFVPPSPIRELRDLTRYRTRHANRLHKVLEDAGITLTSVATRLLGASGRAMLDALVTGTTDPTVLADLARGTLRTKLPALRQALAGPGSAHTTPSSSASSWPISTIWTRPWTPSAPSSTRPWRRSRRRGPASTRSTP